MRKGGLWIGLGSAAAMAAVAAYCRRSSKNKVAAEEPPSSGEEDEEGQPLSFFQNMFLNIVSTGQDQMNYLLLLDSSTSSYPTIQELQQAVDTLKREDEALSAAFIYNGIDHPVKIASNETTAKLSGIVTNIEGSQTWQDILDECRNTVHFPKPPESQGMVPAWKVFYVPKQGAIVFAFHHLLFDGTSVKRLHKALLDVLNNKWSSSNETLQSLECVHQAYPLDSFPTRALWRVVLEMLHRGWIGLRYRKSTWLVRLDPMETRTVVINNNGNARQVFLALTEDQTSSLLRACKDHKVTVHSALTAATSVAVAKIWAPKGISTPMVQTRHLISRWRCLPSDIITKKNLLSGCFVGMATIDVPVEDNDWWSTANKVQYWMHHHPAAITQPTRNMQRYFRMQKWLDRFRYGSKVVAINDALKTGGGVVPAFAISNLGLVNTASSDDKYAIASRYNCSSRHVRPGELGVLSAQTVNGRLHLSWNYASAICTEDRALELTNVILGALAGMSGDSTLLAQSIIT